MHQEYVRCVTDARFAVMFIHGIVGTPDHFTQLLPLVEFVPENWSVYNVLLDGHGGTVEDFSRTSMKKWKNQIWHIFDMLQKSHEKVIIVGHSMGTLFALQLAAEYPDKILQTILFASPLYVRLRLSGLVNCLKVALGAVAMDNPREAATVQACGVCTDKKLWKYVPWLPRMLELLYETGHTREIVNTVRVPILAFQSSNDELVSNRAGRLLEKCKSASVYCLPQSTHFYYAPEDRIVIQSAFLECMTRYKKQD